MTRRRSQKRYRVTYATFNTKGSQGLPKAWMNTNDEDEAEYAAQILNMLPNVHGSYVYDRDKQIIVINYGQEITDHA